MSIILATDYIDNVKEGQIEEIIKEYEYTKTRLFIESENLWQTTYEFEIIRRRFTIMSESKKITLGSGYVYALEYNGSIPANEDIETDANRLGYVQAGATITYAPTYYEVKDDNGDIDEIYITDEVITMKMGIMTWTGNTLNKLCATARVTESGGVRTVKIGGTANDDGKKYILRFVHKSGAIRATIIGTNQNGF